MSSAYRDIDISKELLQCGVTKLGRENTKISMEFHFPAHDGQEITRMVIFNLKQDGFLATVEEFDRQARGGWGHNRRLPLPSDIIEKTKIVFANSTYYPRAFEYYEHDIVNEEQLRQEQSVVSLSEPTEGVQMVAANEEEQRKKEQAYASAISDPDYDDVKRNERLTPISVSNAIRKDPGRYCVYGIIDTVRKPFKLMTEVGFICRDQKCTSYGNPKWQILDTPIFSLDDMPIAFKAERVENGKVKKNGQQRYLELLRCPYCQHTRSVIPSNHGHFDNAKIIELKKLDRITKVSTMIANNTLNMERLTVLVMDTHTWSVGFGEEVEIIGDLHIVGSMMSSSRFGIGSRSGGGSSDSGKAYPIFYADRINYTKRHREIDTEDYNQLIRLDAFNKFASYPKLIERLTSMMSPQIYGHDDVKLGLLLLAAGGAPIQKDNPNVRYWINAGLFGDKGTGKTTMAEDATKLILGSQIVSGQHSTGKGIVAVAERESGNGTGALLRAGAATLANDAICFIDEFGTMNYEDQNQFLSLMEKGYLNFNKLGIRQRIDAKTSFIVTSNPIGGVWQNPGKISKGDIPLKAQIIDRIDLFFVFREPKTDEEIDAFKEHRKKLRRKHFKPYSINKYTGERKYLEQDFPFLRYYLYYIRTQSGFRQIEFEESYLVDRLADLWSEIKKASPDQMTSRGFESIYRIAEAFARLMCKDVIDLEVVEWTIKFVIEMYRRYGAQIAETPDYRTITYLEIAKIVKAHAKNIFWTDEQDNQLEDLTEIAFTAACEEAASKNEVVRNYLGDDFRSSSNKAARHLRDMFREERRYEHGRIKVVSSNKHAEFKLRWVPINEEHTDKNNECDGVTV
ncbi:MAG TPA: AAA family ATPase [Nitrososphaeraceae archaeon]|jgi:DNA replicative helicase MCM subunit Mcm2 (Cdc46/Mcm family)